MATTSVSARFQELFPETNLISLLTKYGGDADDIFETIQDRYDAHEQEPLVGLLGIKAANIDAFARAAYWDFVSDIRVRYLSSLPRSEAAATPPQPTASSRIPKMTISTGPPTNSSAIGMICTAARSHSNNRC